MNEDGELNKQFRSESLSQSDQVMSYTYTGSYARPLTGGTMSGELSGGGANLPIALIKAKLVVTLTAT